MHAHKKHEAADLKLPEQWVKFLKKQPESGMGYHIVNIVFDDGTFATNVVIHNCERIERTQDMCNKTISDIRVVNTNDSNGIHNTT